MRSTGYKKIFIVLLLLAFTGQSFAAVAMPCQFGLHLSNSTNMTDMAGMDHSKMDHGSMNRGNMDHSNMAGMDHSDLGGADPTTPVKPMDCCKTMSHCSSSSCSLTFLSDSFSLFLFPTHTAVNLVYSRVFPETLASELFRPPILG
jgi:hypothetical protein